MIQTMIRTNKLKLLVSAAAALGAPFAFFAAVPACRLAQAFAERLGDGTILAVAAAANALTVVP
jgi:hypothetical protein